MEITLYNNFAKRNNSTRQPTGVSGNTVQATLKDDVSINNPIFLIERSNLNNFDINYCTAFGHYYFVGDVKIKSNGILELSCSIDALASYKADILNSTTNILYSTSSGKNIIDHRIPLISQVSVADEYKAIDNLVILDNTGSSFGSSASVVLGITGSGSYGAYLMKNSLQVKSLLDGVESFNAGKISDVKTGFIQLVSGGMAPENLKSAIGIPIFIEGTEVGLLEPLYMGMYPCTDGNGPILGYRITKPLIKRSTSINIPWVYPDWRRNTPYSEVILYLPLIGLISLPTSELVDETSLMISYVINITSGDISVSVSTSSSGRILSVSSGNIAMATTYGASSVNTTKITTSVVGGLAAIGAGIATGGAALGVAAIAGGLGAVAKGTLDAVGSNQGGSGGLGGGASQGLDKAIHCYVVTRYMSDDPNNFAITMGKPYMAVGKPSQHSGFILTEGFSVDCNADEQIRAKINTTMDSGVFIE